MQSSFLNYYLDRLGLGLSADFDEMAAPAAKFKSGEEVEEHRKTPVFLGNDDLQFLQQFPPSLWKQALAYRYDDLLVDAWNAKERGKRLKDPRNVRLYYRGGRQGKFWVVFPQVKTGANELIERLTADVDDVYLSQLGPNDKQKYLDHIKDKALGQLGYVLKGIKKGENLGASKGFVFPTEGVWKDRLGSLYQAHEEGWYGDYPKDAAVQKMTMGGGGQRNLMVHTPEELKSLPGHGYRYGVDDKGRRTWIAYREDTGKPLEIAEYLPKLNPATMVPTKAVNEFRARMGHHKSLENAFEQGGVQGFWMAYRNREAVKDQDTLDMLDRFDKYVEAKKLDPRNLDENQFKHLLHGFSQWLFKSARKIRDESPRYDTTDWNIHQFNPTLKKPHTSWTGFGTWNPNWQQPRRIHGGLQRLGIDPQEFWDEIKQYLVQAGTTKSEDGGEIPYTKTWKDENGQMEMGALAKGINAYLRRANVYQTVGWYAIMKNWWEVFDNASDYMRRQLGSGEFLPYARMKQAEKQGQKLDIEPSQAQAHMMRAAYNAGYSYAGMIYQLKSRMGGGTSPGMQINDILDDPSVVSSMASSGGAIASRWNRAFRPEDPGFSQHGDHGRTSHAISTLHRVIDQELEKMAQSPQGIAAVNQAVGRESNTAASVAGFSTGKEHQLTKNIIDTGLAFMVYRHIYIHSKQEAGEQWNVQQANEFASRAVDKWLQARGVRVFGGKIGIGGDQAKGTGAYSVAKRHKSEEERYRKQMSDMGYQQQLAAKQQSPGTVAPQVEEDHHAQAQKLLMLTRMVDDVKTLRELNKKSKSYNPELRAFFEKIVQDRSLGWPIIKVILRRVDQSAISTKK